MKEQMPTGGLKPEKKELWEKTYADGKPAEYLPKSENLSEIEKGFKYKIENEEEKVFQFPSYDNITFCIRGIENPVENPNSKKTWYDRMFNKITFEDAASYLHDRPDLLKSAEKEYQDMLDRKRKILYNKVLDQLSKDENFPLSGKITIIIDSCDLSGDNGYDGGRWHHALKIGSNHDGIAQFNWPRIVIDGFPEKLQNKK